MRRVDILKPANFEILVTNKFRKILNFILRSV